MTPFYFGSGARRLFGIYDPPAVGGPRTRAAVLCHPWGEEYLYAHRAMRRLAIKLSGAGFHVLRFDFFGTGDSAGDMTDADLAAWESDTELAMAELRDMANASRVTLIGLRLGGAIAARVASRHADDVDALVLWDPIVSGEGYPPGVGAAASDGTLDVQGFPLTATLRRAMRAIDLGPLLAEPATRSLLAMTERLPCHAALTAVPAGAARGSLAIDVLTDVRPWLWTNKGAIPVVVIEKIVHWLG